MSATVREAFNDYKEQGNILDCNVININLYKKSKRIEVSLESNIQIDLEETYVFENYLKHKFDVEKAITYVKIVGALR